jgi:16S rRNA (cytidine1402-2'-O)-methyltransferase
MAGTLYVVATPIGNLEDVTLRALRILREVSLIAAEDTRRTAKLLQHYSISTRTTSLHAHNEREKAPRLVERLRAGDSIALVSDAGTPVISDPGGSLVAAARGAGVRVESIPGPSAVMAAISAAGLPSEEFVFLGFPPSRSKARQVWLARLVEESRLAVFFEAPHRIKATLEELSGLIGGERTVAVGRELTKAHEELVVRPINTVLGALSSLKGEFTVLLPPKENEPSGASGDVDLGKLRAKFGRLTENNGLGRREALKALSVEHGIAVNELYRLLQSNINKSNDQ